MSVTGIFLCTQILLLVNKLVSAKKLVKSVHLEKRLLVLLSKKTHWGKVMYIFYYCTLTGTALQLSPLTGVGTRTGTRYGDGRLIDTPSIGTTGVGYISSVA